MEQVFDVKRVMEEYRMGDIKEAAEKICEQLRPLVHKISKQYGHDENIREDLVQEGFTAILNGMRHYDPEKSKPVTYFTKCITNAVRDYAWKEKYKVSRYYRKEIAEVKQAIIDLENTNIPSTVENVAGYLSEEISETRETMELIYSIDHSFSLDEPEFYELEYIDEQFVTIEVEETVSELYAQLDRLDSYSIEFLCRRYGIGYEKMTRAEMVVHYQMTNYCVDKEIALILGRLKKYIGEYDGLSESISDLGGIYFENY